MKVVASPYRLPPAACRLPSLALMLVTAIAATAGAQNGGRTTHSGVYSRAQAARGQDVYMGMCKSCHSADAYTASTFTSKWEGKALAELYLFIRDNMPKNEPGGLTPEEYADVLAYLLSINRMPAGDTDLPPDADRMKSIRFHLKPTVVRKEK
jgi:mono/diheme cytochrome c family protein